MILTLVVPFGIGKFKGLAVNTLRGLFLLRNALSGRLYPVRHLFDVNNSAGLELQICLPGGFAGHGRATRLPNPKAKKDTPCTMMPLPNWTP